MDRAHARLAILQAHLGMNEDDRQLPFSECAGESTPDADPADQELVRVNKATGKAEMQRYPRTVTFDQGLFYAIRTIELMKEYNPQTTVFVGISGPTGSGKTTLASRIADMLDAFVLDMQRFVKIENVIDQNYQDPSFMDFNRVTEVVDALKRTRTAVIPDINYEKKIRLPDKTITVPESNVVVIEGLYALHSSIHPMLDVTIAVDGGVHLDLIKRITRDIQVSKSTSKDVILQISGVLFPMYKAFTEPDMVTAKLRIHSTYNPIAALTDPTYVCKAELSTVQDKWDEFMKTRTPGTVITRKIHDMYLIPSLAIAGDAADDLRNWIRIRQVDGLFYIHFYNEINEQAMNIRPGLNFEISVQTIAGLLSLGYQMGATMHRTTETVYEQDGTTITLEHFQELQETYVQVKGSNRNDVLSRARALGIQEKHVRETFLQLYLRKFKPMEGGKKKDKSGKKPKDGKKVKVPKAAPKL